MKREIRYFEEEVTFDEIRAGDLIETRWKEDGVTDVSRGVAFKIVEREGFPGMAWLTSEGGLLAADYTGNKYHRITFEGAFEEKNV